MYPGKPVVESILAYRNLYFQYSRKSAKISSNRKRQTNDCCWIQLLRFFLHATHRHITSFIRKLIRISPRFNKEHIKPTRFIYIHRRYKYVLTHTRICHSLQTHPYYKRSATRVHSVNCLYLCYDNICALFVLGYYVVHVGVRR